MRCLIVDDEPLAVSTLRRLLGGRSDVAIVGEACSVTSAYEACVALRHDLILLDIQLGDGSGFEVLERLEQVPEVIFTTAYNQHAVRAFEINALDYLMKLIEVERLIEALERAAKRLARSEKSSFGKLKGAAANRSLIELAGTRAHQFQRRSGPAAAMVAAVRLLP